MAEQLEYWESLLSFPSTKASVGIELLCGQAPGELCEAPLAQTVGGAAYQVEPGTIVRFHACNATDSTAYLYFIDVLPSGRFLFVPLLDIKSYEGL